MSDGANQTTNIYDMTTTPAAVGTGKLLSRSSYHAMTDPNLLGLGTPRPTARPAASSRYPPATTGWA